MQALASITAQLEGSLMSLDFGAILLADTFLSLVFAIR